MLVVQRVILACPQCWIYCRCSRNLHSMCLYVYLQDIPNRNVAALSLRVQSLYAKEIETKMKKLDSGWNNKKQFELTQWFAMTKGREGRGWTCIHSFLWFSSLAPQCACCLASPGMDVNWTIGLFCEQYNSLLKTKPFKKKKKVFCWISEPN